jgi:hypothetical protein
MTAPGPGAPEPAPAAAASNAPNAIDWSTPEVELLAERLHERVNGLAPLLLELGCRRLLAWRLERPPIEIELLSFADAAGARRALEREAGPDRTPGAPGDEGYASAQVVYFRSGGAFARASWPWDPRRLAPCSRSRAASSEPSQRAISHPFGARRTASPEAARPGGRRGAGCEIIRVSRRGCR